MKSAANGATAPRADKEGRFLVSRGDPAVLAWFAERLWVAHGRRERWRRTAAIVALRRGASGVAGRLALRATRRPHLGERELESRWAPVLEAAAAAFGPLEALGLSGDRSILLRDRDSVNRGRHLLFAFGERQACPEAVVKLRPVKAPGVPLAREHAALQSIRRRLDGALRETLPEPLAYAVESGTEILVLTCLPGRSAYVELHGRLAPLRCAPRHVLAAADWLARFHLATRARPEPEAPVPVHGDFWSRNLLLGADGTAAGVVDWECAEGEGSPLEDLLHFAMTYALDFPWRRGRRVDAREAARLALVDDNLVARALRAYFQRYAQATGLDAAGFRAALLEWLEARTDGIEETAPWNDIRTIIATSPSAFSG